MQQKHKAKNSFSKKKQQYEKLTKALEENCKTNETSFFNYLSNIFYFLQFAYSKWMFAGNICKNIFFSFHCNSGVYCCYWMWFSGNSMQPYSFFSQIIVPFLCKYLHLSVHFDRYSWELINWMFWLNVFWGYCWTNVIFIPFFAVDM